jgi:hypothetical protein
MAPDDRSRLHPAASMRNLHHDPASTSRWRFTRSTASMRDLAAESAPALKPLPPLKPLAPKLERSTSRMSLFNLFSRPKVERARGHTEVGLAVPMRPQTPPKPAPLAATPKPSRREHSPPTQSSLRSRSSHMFRPTSMKPSPTSHNSDDWDPPPLFQAFPQSIKHATIQTCVFPPEVLMRTQSQRRQAEVIRERIDSARDLSIIPETGPETRKLDKSHRRLISNSVYNSTTPELVSKIYILVTSGYVVQYAGDGPFDRLPEKVLKIGKDSAAFACDLVPGKHWVLQISSHAHDDGTIESGPRSSILTRLRAQNAVEKKLATSFLLVLESAEEMDGWMTAVRKEIDNRGGQRTKDESIRASSSIDGSSGKPSSETSHRYLVQRDPNVITKIGSANSNSKPTSIATSDWETERSSSVASAARDQASRGKNRRSVEGSSMASTPTSQDHMQLDQLRGRSRFSYMSAATSVSTSGTRDSSPAPTSPKEGFRISGEEHLRGTAPHRALHSNPLNNASRRRSVQPLPVTNEDNSVEVPSVRSRHSFYEPLTPPPPPSKDSTQMALDVSAPAPIEVAKPAPFVAAKGLTAHIASQDRSRQYGTSVAAQVREDSPVRFDAGHYTFATRERKISPPPRETAPIPPRNTVRQSVGHAPSSGSPAPNTYDASRQRRISATPKPFLRPFPVRPQAQHADPSQVIPRRVSSAIVASSPVALGTRSVTAPPRQFTANASSLPPAAQPLQPLPSPRRPTSVQARPSPAPFSTSVRPVRAISSTPSFVPGTGRRASSTSPSPTKRDDNIPHSPSVGLLNPEAQAPTLPKHITPRRSMPALALPPPAPPPDMPLPPPPPNSSYPTPPPNMPLPPPPPMAASRGVAI